MALSRSSDSIRGVSIWITRDNWSSDDFVWRHSYTPRGALVAVAKRGSKRPWRNPHLRQPGARTLVDQARKLLSRGYRSDSGSISPVESFNWKNRHTSMLWRRVNPGSTVVRSAPTLSGRLIGQVGTVISSPVVRSAPALPRRERVPSNVVAARSGAVEE